jgi:predicted RecB family endonuclease
MPDPITIGRDRIAKLAEADGEMTFAYEVRAGCWDHRNDVRRAIVRELLTGARKTIIMSARKHEPAAWIVSTTGGRTGHERNSWKRNCEWLAGNGLMYANAHGDWTLTEEGEELREELLAAR